MHDYNYADSLTKKNCTALRRTLHDAYQNISQGQNDIINHRHDVSEVQDKHGGRKMLQPNISTGLKLIKIRLGHRQDQKRKCTYYTRLSFPEDDDTDNTEQAWIPQFNQRLIAELMRELNKASLPDTIMVTQGQTHPRAHQLQSTLNGVKFENEIMRAFCG